MTVGDLSDSAAVQQAIDEFDRIGRDAFLQKYGFGPALEYVVVQDGREYDSKAIIGAAHGYQFGEPLLNSDFSGGLHTAVQKLRALGFTVNARSESGDTSARATDEGARWNSAIDVCRPLLEDRTFLDEEEINYKLEISARVKTLLQKARLGEPIYDQMKIVLGPPNNLFHWVVKGKFEDWVQSNEEAARRALLELDADGSAAQRIDRFLELAPSEVLVSEGNKLSFASLFLMGLEPAECPVYFPEPIKTGEKLLGWPKPSKDQSFGERYEHHRKFVAEFLSRLKAADAPARDMLDAQSLIWHLVKSDSPAAAAWRGDETKSSGGTIDLILKWSASKEAKTIDYHREVAEGPAGAVWWGRYTKNARATGLSEKPLAALTKQLETGNETFIFLHGATTWKTRLLAITTDKADVDPELVPSYYDPSTHHSLWVKITDFEEIEAEQLLHQYVLASSGEPITQKGLGNQGPLIVRRQALAQESRYFILNQSFDGAQYGDVEGQSYQWNENSSGAWKQLASASGAQFIYYRTGSAPDGTAQTYFGHGKIGEVDESVDQGGKRTFSAAIEDFEPFESPIPLKEGPSRNVQTSINPLTAAQFEKLIAQGMPDQEVEPLSRDALKGQAEEKGLKLSEELFSQVLAALSSGKHIILTGPPGTAKTTFAQAIAETASTAGHSNGYQLTTATADWTTFETIGGLRPTQDGELEFSPGHFLAAIEDQQWLLIDELNRSNFDRAFGQLFTVLSGQPVTLPYARGDGSSGQIVLVPEGAEAPASNGDPVEIPQAWRIVATMNVFDKTLLFEMSFALMRRFAFIEVPSPEGEVFEALIEEASSGSEKAAELASKLLGLRELKDLGPAVYMDIARYLNSRESIEAAEDGQLLFEAFYSYLLPQFEGVDAMEGEQLFKKMSQLIGTTARRERLRATLNAVLGLDLKPPDAATDPEPQAE